MKTAARLLKKYQSVENLCRHLDEVGSMKFRYAARVQQSLIDHRSQLETSLALTRIECEIEAMRQIETARRNPDHERIETLISAQGFDAPRRQRWRDLRPVQRRPGLQRRDL